MCAAEFQKAESVGSSACLSSRQSDQTRHSLDDFPWLKSSFFAPHFPYSSLLWTPGAFAKTTVHHGQGLSFPISRQMCPVLSGSTYLVLSALPWMFRCIVCSAQPLRSVTTAWMKTPTIPTWVALFFHMIDHQVADSMLTYQTLTQLQVTMKQVLCPLVE